MLYVVASPNKDVYKRQPSLGSIFLLSVRSCSCIKAVNSKYLSVVAYKGKQPLVPLMRYETPLRFLKSLDVSTAGVNVLF